MALSDLWLSLGSVGCVMNPMTEERIDLPGRERADGARAREFGAEEAQVVPFICECADEHCTTTVPLSLSEYEGVRTNSRQFLTVFGHERFEGLIEVVATNHNHLVVRKSAGEIHRSSDDVDGDGKR